MTKASTDSSKNDDMVSERSLTEVEKARIRRYLFTLFAIPTVVSTALFGGVGYLIGSVWTGKAYQDAYRETWNLSQTGILSAGANSTKAVAEAEVAKGLYDRLSQEVDTLSGRLKSELKMAQQLSTELQSRTEMPPFFGHSDC